LFELRPIKQIGVVVNIILNIAEKIIWFAVIFAIFIIGFTQALLHMLHTRKEVPCGDNCEGGVFQDDYPTNFLSALSATYFFLAGIYDPVSEPMEGGGVSFHIMMTIFFTFTSILFLNILIAVMNDAFNESKEQGEVAWLKQWSEVIADMEFIFFSRERYNGNYSPDYIYYGSGEKDANDYESEYCVDNKSHLSIEDRFIVDTISEEQELAQRTISQDVNRIICEELEKVKKGFEHKLEASREESRQLLEAARDDSRQILETVNRLMTLIPIASSVQMQPTGSSAP
ncbi:hypothetical protein BGZ58_004209, partial [Dissophora ornata]